MSEISEKQLEANRRNSQLGGVKTEEGKAISRYNAIKHGLLCKEVFLKDEDENELIELGKRLRNELQPSTELELVLVDRIAANTWRLKRLLKVERQLIEQFTYTENLAGDSITRNTGQAFSSLAYTEGFDKYTRYEGSLERGIYKALHELQRLQAGGSDGQVLPPPVIEVDSE